MVRISDVNLETRREKSRHTADAHGVLVIGCIQADAQKWAEGPLAVGIERFENHCMMPHLRLIPGQIDGQGTKQKANSVTKQQQNDWKRDSMRYGRVKGEGGWVFLKLDECLLEPKCNEALH